MRVKDGYFEIYQFDLPAYLYQNKIYIDDFTKDLDTNYILSKVLQVHISIQLNLEFINTLKQKYEEFKDYIKSKNKQNLPIKFIVIGERE